MSFLMTLSAEEHAVIMTMRQKTGKHLFFDDNGAEMPVKPKSTPAEKKTKKTPKEKKAISPSTEDKPKRTLTEEHKAKLKVGREAARTKKAAAETLLSMPPADTSSSTPVSADENNQLSADALQSHDLSAKTNQELRDIYHPLVGKKIGMRTSAGLPDKAALVEEIMRLRASGHTPENPSKKAKAE